MRRRSTIISIPSLLIFAGLLAALGLTIWRQGGLAFSPGPLSSSVHPDIRLAGYGSHAEFEEQCSLCHQPLSKMQAELCVECHTNIGDQLIKPASLHGKIEAVMQCAVCHRDHLGREFDTRLGSLDDFDHSVQTFSLIWHQKDYGLEPVSCLDCHVTDNQFSVPNASCTTCHAGGDGDFISIHITEFGEGCVDCHDGLDSIARFDHANSNFQLEGVHQDLACAACHIQGQFKGMSQNCATCHAEPPEHQGMFDEDCAACHDADSWSPALISGVSFVHNRDTRFNLDLHQFDFGGAPISCQSCHQEQGVEFSPATCYDCHGLEDPVGMLQHQEEMGSRCLECHDGTDRMRSFDHQTVFQLDGSHLEVACQACHVEQLYQGTPSQCRDCHAEPEIHLGYFGFTCEYCHETSSWYPAQLTQHTFPIDHGEQEEPVCKTCHVATYGEYTCYSCHEHSQERVADKHRDFISTIDELSNCMACHLDGRVHADEQNEE